jgi:PAT family beta-lactamase induction signal transducer AmpG
MTMHGPTDGLPGFVVLLSLAAFAGATQDIVVDAYRIEIAPVESQAALAATYSLGYRIALYASGAGALYLAEYQGWRWVYLVMAALMLPPIVATLLSREPDGTNAEAIRQLDLGTSFMRPFQEFFSRHGWTFALILFAFIGFFKFPDQVIGVMAGPFYLDSGYTKGDIATVSKIYGVWIGLAGAFIGGFGVAAFGVRLMLVLATIAVAGSNLAFLLMAQYPSEIWAFFAAISADNLSQGFAGTVLVAFLSGLTHRDYTATQFALLVTFANLPGKFVGGLSGYLVEGSSYSTFFVMSSLTAIPAALLLAWLWPRIGSRGQS